MHQLTKLDLTQEELFACNCCRLYLRALFLSDIVSGDGTEIAETAWIGTRDEYFRATSWPFALNHLHQNGVFGGQHCRRPFATEVDA
jgi:hypothetical protein